MTISVIIPTLNEAARISDLLHYLFSLPSQDALAEVIVVDGGSRDATLDIAQQAGAQVLTAPQKGRAAQMNFAARAAQGDILYFIHADVYPPASCLANIQNSLTAGAHLGCFAYDFDSDALLLKFNAWLTRFNWRATGGGDQTLFLGKATFVQLGGFNEQLPIMEDFDFVWRAKQQGLRMSVLPARVRVSARKYEKNSYLKVQIVNTIAFVAFRWGYAPQKLARWYHQTLS